MNLYVENLKKTLRAFIAGRKGGMGMQELFEQYALESAIKISTCSVGTCCSYVVTS